MPPSFFFAAVSYTFAAHGVLVQRERSSITISPTDASPEVTANWVGSGEKWTVPVGGGFGKAFHLGAQAVKVDFNTFYNAIRPKAGNDTWLPQVKLTFQFPDSAQTQRRPFAENE